MIMITLNLYDGNDNLDENKDDKNNANGHDYICDDKYNDNDNADDDDRS